MEAVQEGGWEGFVVGGDRTRDAKRRIVEAGLDPRFVLGALEEEEERDRVLAQLADDSGSDQAPAAVGGEKIDTAAAASQEIREEVALDALGSTTSSKNLAAAVGEAPLAAALLEAVEAIPDDFGVLLVVGPSSSGVSSMLRVLRKRFDVPAAPAVRFGRSSAVASEVKAARDWFPAVGLNDIKAWCHPYCALSNGQRQRVRLAKQLAEVVDPSAGTAVDDLGAAVDEADGRAIAYSLSQLFRGRGGRTWRHVLVGTHADLSSFLQPDLVLQLRDGSLPPRLIQNPNRPTDRRVRLLMEIGKMGRWQLPAETPAPPTLARQLRAHLSDTIGEAHGKAEQCQYEEMVSTVRVDEYTEAAAAAFEVEFNGTVRTQVPRLAKRWVAGDSWRLGLVIGPSGSGKTTALRRVLQEAFGGGRDPEDADASALTASAAICDLAEEPWDEGKSVDSQLKGSPSLAHQILEMVGLPQEAWRRPIRTLSSSEQSRAALARSLARAAAVVEAGEVPSPVLVDEFTTELDRSSARELCLALRGYLAHKPKLQIVLATVFEDVCGWFGGVADWAFLTNRGLVIPRPTFAEQEPRKLPEEPDLEPPRLTVDLSIVEDKDEKLKLWKSYFHQHHYLSGDLNMACDAILARERTTRLPVAFLAIKVFPGFQKCNCHYGRSHMWVEHRLVVRPAWQNFGLGTRMSNEVGRRVVAQGEKYVGKTAHPRLALHRERNQQWKRHGRFLAEIESLDISAGGRVQLRGPALNWQLPSHQAMLFDLHLKHVEGARAPEGFAEVIAGLQGRTLKLVPATSQRGSSKHEVCFQVQGTSAVTSRAHAISEGQEGAQLGSPTESSGSTTESLAVEGLVVFFQPAKKAVVTGNTGQIAVLRGLGPDSLSLVCSASKVKDKRPMLRLVTAATSHGRAGCKVLASAPAEVQGLKGPKEAFEAVALLAFSGAGQESEEANVRTAFARLQRGKRLPVEVVEAVRGGLKLKPGTGRLLPVKKRVVFSYEFVADAS